MDPDEAQPTLDPFGTVDAPQSQSGQTLGDYRLLGQLGQGGMGVVYEAESLIDGSKVALKTLMSGSSETLARLKAEFRVLADLTHPNLVRLGELNTTDRDPFFTMEIVRGVSFDHYVSASLESAAAIPALPFNEDRLRNTLLQLASGLIALHSAGLVHRDIKPSNVMVTHEGRVVILDMGLAAETKSLNDSNASLALAGTPYFMAPEQMQGKEVTAACDWYAVGVMLFEAMTGEKLFQSRRLGDLATEKFQNRRCRVRDILPDVADDLSGLCERMLSAKPDERPSGHEVLKLLSGTSASRAESSAWIGREQELSQLMMAWEKVTQGLTQVVLIAGPSGIGKTSLVDHFIGELRKSKPVIVLSGRCYENEAVPYRGFDSIVDSLSNYLQRLPQHHVERVLPIDLDVLCQVFPVLRSVSAVAAQLRPLGQVLGDARDLAQRGIVALRELLCRLAKFESVVLFLDDLQQGDEDTAAVFRDLFRQGQAPALLCLCTYRSEDAETSVCLNRIRRVMQAKADQSLMVEQLELNIDRLTSQEALALAEALLEESQEGVKKNNENMVGSYCSAVAAKIASESGGDPLFLRMLVESHLRGDANLRDSDARSKGDGNDAWTLTTVIKNRLSALEPSERRAVEILATAGRPLIASELESIVGGDQSSVGLIRSLRIQKLIKRLGDRERVELYHDKIRETALSIVPPQQQSKYCLSLADFLEQAGKTSDVELLADLCRRAGQFSRAGVYYQQSAEAASAAFAFNRAIECYRYAIEYSSGENVNRVKLTRGLADALANASRSAEAAAEYLKAAELASAEEKPRLQQLAALRYLTSGHVEQGIATLRQVLDFYRLPWPASKMSAIAGLLSRNLKLQFRSLQAIKARATTDRDAAVHDACWTAAAGLSLVDPLRGSFYVSETLLRSLDLGKLDTLPRDLAAFMGQSAIGGSRGRKVTARILIASRQLGRENREDPYIKAMPMMSRGIAALLRGEWVGCLKCCDRAAGYLSSPECYGKTWELSTARTFALWSLQYQGDLVELSRRQPDLLNAAIAADDLFATLNYGTQVMSHLQLAADQPHEALRRLEADRERLSNRGFFIQHHNYVLASAYTYLYLGEYQKAIEAMDGLWGKYQQSFLSQIQQVRIDYYQVYARVLVAAIQGGVLHAREIRKVRSVSRKLKRERAAWANAFSLYLDGVCLAVDGSGEQARAKLADAGTVFERQSMKLFANAARHQLMKFSSVGNQTNMEKSWSDCGVSCGERMASMLLPGF